MADLWTNLDDILIGFLGKYAIEVLSAYAVSLTLILVLVLMSFSRSRRMKAALREVEDRVKERK
ncbi:heme exporter protein CcmD [Lentibacter algarum]|uniref:heme exporter protein CcmD n=1 Tax=Lentibacter algarum TaxID=576131 RepID=UPI0020901B9A|nr:heme exporter protein CcmD [Lentibacter algarum]